MSGYLLTTNRTGPPQGPADESFIGGVPKLPAAEPIPACSLCQAPQTFMFQAAFPPDHGWHGLSLAVFACTSCVDADHLIPTMLSGRLPGVQIPENYLKSYQDNFRLLVFETRAGTPRREYKEKVAFRRLALKPAPAHADAMMRLGGRPQWLTEDETPGSYAGGPMLFLLQLPQGFPFELVPSAPPQTQLGLDFSPELSPHRYYELFNANVIYFFGTEDRREPLVYVLTQVD